MFEYTICVKIEFTDISTMKREFSGDIVEMKNDLNNGIKEAIENETGVKFDDFHVEVKVFEREFNLLED